MNIITKTLANLWCETHKESNEMFAIAKTAQDAKLAQVARSLSNDLWQQCYGIENAIKAIDPDFDVYDYLDEWELEN